MKKIDVVNLKGEKVKNISLDDNVFGITPNDKVLYDAVILARASLRQGTHKTKNRSEVRGGGRKPWKQKGTGRARQGSIRAVQWVGGGNYGTPVPRDYSKKQNRKERKLAMLSALSHKFNDKELIVLESLNFTTPKTKQMISLLDDLKLSDKKTLIVVNEFNENLLLASRNVPNVVVITPREVSVLDLVGADKVLMTMEAIEKVEEVLK